MSEVGHGLADLPGEGEDLPGWRHGVRGGALKPAEVEEEGAELAVLQDEEERAVRIAAGAQQFHHIRVIHILQQMELGYQIVELLPGATTGFGHLDCHHAVTLAVSMRIVR